MISGGVALVSIEALFGNTCIMSGWVGDTLADPERWGRRLEVFEC